MADPKGAEPKEPAKAGPAATQPTRAGPAPKKTGWQKAGAAGKGVVARIPLTGRVNPWRRERLDTVEIKRKIRKEQIEAEERERAQPLGVDPKAAKGEHLVTLNNALAAAIIHGQARGPQKINPDALMRSTVCQPAFRKAIYNKERNGGLILSPFEEDDEDYRESMLELKDRSHGPRMKLAEQLETAAGNTAHIIAKLSNEQLDILYSTMLLNPGLWVTESELRKQRIENPKAEAPECGLWPEGVPKPHEAFFRFLESTAIRKSPDKTGEFIGSVLLDLSTKATLGEMKGETRFKLMNKEMAERYLGGKANQAIEETVADFRARISKVLTTPKDEIEPDSGVPGLGLNNHPQLGLITDAGVRQAGDDMRQATDAFTRAAGEEADTRKGNESAHAAKVSADSNLSTAGIELEGARAKLAGIERDAAELERGVASGNITRADAASKVPGLSSQMTDAKREVTDAEAKVAAARAEAARKDSDLGSATAAHQATAGRVGPLKQQMDVAEAVFNAVNDHMAGIDERVDELAEHFRDELLSASDSGGNINSVITKLEKRIVHPDVWKVAREERINELTALMEEIKTCYPKDTRAALATNTARMAQIQAQLDSAALQLEAMAAGMPVGLADEEGGASKAMVKRTVPMQVIDMYKQIITGDDRNKLKKLGDFFHSLGDKETGTNFLRLANEMEVAKKDEAIDAEFEDRRAEFTKKLAEFKTDVDASGLPPSLRARMMTLHDMIGSCSHEERAIQAKAKIIMETYGYPMRVAAKKSIECFDERRYDNLTGIPESQWIIARMIFESQSKGIESETGLASDGPWKKRFQKVLWYVSRQGVKRIGGGLWKNPWPLIKYRLPLTTSPKEDVEAFHAPWTEKTKGRNWRGEVVDSWVPRKAGGALGGAIKIYVLGGFLAGHFASHDEVEWYNPMSWPAPIVHKLGMGSRVESKTWKTWVTRPDTWWRGLRGDERIVRVFDDSYDLPQKLTSRPDSYFTSERGFNLGTQLPSESDGEEAKARLEWAKTQPEVLRFMQERVLTPQRDRPMRVVDSLSPLEMGNDKRNADTCGGGRVVFEDQDKTAEQKKAAEKEDAPEYHWYKPGSWAHLYTPWKGVATNEAQKTEAPKADAAKPDDKAGAPKDEKAAAKPDEKAGAAAKTDGMAGVPIELDKRKVPVACTRTFGWSAPPDVKFSNIFVTGKDAKSGNRQTRIGGTLNQTADGVQKIKTEVSLLKPDPKTGRYSIGDLASYEPVSNPNDGWTTDNRFCCALSIRYEEIADARVLNTSPGFADKLVADVMADLFIRDESGDLVPNTVSGRGTKFVDGKGQVKREYFEDQRTVFRMVESGQLVSLNQGQMMKDLGFYKLANVDFLRSKPESPSVQRFIRMCTKANDPVYVRKETTDRSGSKPRDYFVRTWRENVKKALPAADPVMDSIPEETMKATLEATVAERKALTEDVAREYEQGKLASKFKDFKLSKTALDTLYAQPDILQVVTDYHEAQAADYKIVKPRASEFVYAMAQYSKTGGNVQEFSFKYTREPAQDGAPQKIELGPKVKWAVAKGYLSRTGEVEDNKTEKAKGDNPETLADPVAIKFWDNQVGFDNLVRNTLDGLRDSKAEGRVMRDALERVYGKEVMKLEIDVRDEIYRVLSAKDNNGTDEKAKAEKAAFDQKKDWVMKVSGEGADMKVAVPSERRAKAKAVMQLRGLISQHVKGKLEAKKTQAPTQTPAPQ